MSVSDTEGDSVENVIATVQSMIDFTAKHLDGLRTQCATTEEITQRQIRDTESKIIKLFSKQLVSKLKLAQDELQGKLSEYPKTDQWLKVVGINEDAIKGVLERGLTLDMMLEMSEEAVRNLLIRFDCTDDEIRKLNVALKNLNLWKGRQLQGDAANANDSDLELHWTNYPSASSSPYGGNSPKYHAQRPSTSSLPPETTQPPQIQTPPQSTPSSPIPRSYIDRPGSRYTPPPTPSLVRPKQSAAKYPSTPPPKKKNQLFPEFPLKKSKSHESQLANRVTDIDSVKNRKDKKVPQNLELGSSIEMLYARRLSNEGSDTGGSSRGPSGHTSPVLSSPLHSPPYKQDRLTVPRSPKTFNTVKMMHQISHRFVTKLLFGSICDICRKYVFRGRVCRYCKFKCHRDCASKASASCSLPDKLLDVFIESVLDGSPVPSKKVINPNSLQGNQTDALSNIKSVMSAPLFQIPDSSSNTSSYDSSTPSSPALVPPSSGTVTSPSPAPSPQIQITHFQYPGEFPWHFIEPGASATPDVVSTNTSNDSDKTLVDSNTSERTLLDRVDSVDSQDDPLGHNWNRQNSLSVTLKEWDIPFEEIVIGDPIGTGRFGTVYKGHWHGDVAIKVLKMDSETDNQSQLPAFKLEVAMLRKTRHENLVLFMGACMKPPHLAIVTSLCKGQTLYKSVHIRKEKFLMNKIVNIASQIAQGTGYLHARDIIHKDLKSKNIFLENGKVVITDFGLFNVTKLCHGNRKGDWLSIPPGWLCYLSPEIIRSLQARSQHSNSELDFTQKSDVYAFGTVLYELLCFELPFKKQPPESIIWQVGRGIKQSLGNIPASKDVKDILMMCWSYKPDDRPDFSQILKALGRLPKKPLMRSPSHPVHLSRSVDSVFT
ncbi:hypothetical protein ScPMuIL_005561 [Solemya velum]